MNDIEVFIDLRPMMVVVKGEPNRYMIHGWEYDYNHKRKRRRMVLKRIREHQYYTFDNSMITVSQYFVLPPCFGLNSVPNSL
jgi:hypothetical protein